MFAGALAVVVALLALVGGSVLWTRPLWMDEVAMYFLTGEASPVRMLRLIGQGGDWNPPTLHLVVWSVMRLTGVDALSPVFLRSFSLVCVSVAMVLLYAALRRTFGRASSVAGILVVAGQTLVIEHAFEGRFYGPWLGIAVGFLWALEMDADRPRSRRRDIVLAALSVLLVTIHWYGIFSLGLMCAGALASQRRRWREGARLVAPAIAGVGVLAALTPLALAQRASAAPVLWVQPLNLAQVEDMTSQFAPAALVVVLAVLLLLSVLGRRNPNATVDESSRPDVVFGKPAMAATLALGLMPLVLVFLSVALTPSMVYRYAIVASLAWAPVVALVATMLVRPALVALIAFLAVSVCIRTAGVIRDHAQFARVVGTNAQGYEQAKAMNVPIVFLRLQIMYAVAGTQRSPTTPARYLGLTDSIIDAMYPWRDAGHVRSSMRLDRDQALYHTRLFGWPILTPLSSFDSIPRFAIVATDMTLPPVYTPMDRYAARMFPHHRATKLGPALTLLELAPARAPTPRAPSR